MRDIRYIVVHEAACPPYKADGSEFTISDIDVWHKRKGFKRNLSNRTNFNPDLASCGYHYVIGRTGTLWTGRHEDELPAAVKGFNTVSINICLIGQDGDFSDVQWEVLKELVILLSAKYSKAIVVGHCDEIFNSGKTCPGFDVKKWWKP